MAEPRDDGTTITLRDGRSLGVLEVGDPTGRPLFYFHGHPGSRLEALLCDATAKRHRARIIAIDRPGYGLSEPRPGRQILDWPTDVAEIAERMRVERFGVIGVSGGGPYAAACAFAMPLRVSCAALVAGVGPIDVPDATAGMMLVNKVVLRVSRVLPFLPHLAMAIFARLFARNGEAVLERVAKAFPPKDRAVLGNPDVRRIIAAAVTEGFRQGARDVARDTELYTRPWGFDLSDIEVEVHVFQGERDIQVPPTMGHYQAQAIPGAKAHFYDEDGHFSLAIDRMEDILAALVHSPGWSST